MTVVSGLAHNSDTCAMSTRSATEERSIRALVWSAALGDVPQTASAGAKAMNTQEGPSAHKPHVVPPVSARPLHLNDVSIRLVLLGWVGRASLVVWVPRVLCAAPQLADASAKEPQRARLTDRATGSGRHCPAPFPHIKLSRVSSLFSWRHGMDARGAEGGDCHAQHPHFGLRKFTQNAPSQWGQQALKDTPDHTNCWAYTPWLSMSLGPDSHT
jgi:hypothetical protein